MSRKLGEEAEERAVELLRAKGYVIVERNFLGKVGELDIVARDGDCVVFVEVRSRADSAYGLPQETVTRDKQRKLIKTAQLYIQARGLHDVPMRFDVIAETPDGLEHFEDAFTCD